MLCCTGGSPEYTQNPQRIHSRDAAQDRVQLHSRGAAQDRASAGHTGCAQQGHWHCAAAAATASHTQPAHAATANHLQVHTSQRQRKQLARRSALPKSSISLLPVMSCATAGSSTRLLTMLASMGCHACCKWPAAAAAPAAALASRATYCCCCCCCLSASQVLHLQAEKPSDPVLQLLLMLLWCNPATCT
ncbi:hypothetical protein COO60DRAFT_1187329 [Scenedesmus sp. NREL 46B-D3]|nr:hypothetical protein COO60DRAFT_1187329 [Scenedesmus sp. NREL 46B-D3]